MRLATFNIRHGRSRADSVVDLDRFRAAVRVIDADILALQEVDLDQPRSARADLTAIAAEAMGAVSHRFAATLSGSPEGAWTPASGTEQPGTPRYGIALLSRYPATHWQVMRLPRIPLRFPLYLRDPRRAVILREEPRAVLAARLETPLGPLTVANTHLSFAPGWNRVQLRRMRDELAVRPGPLVLMGDFNMTPPALARGSRLRSLGGAPTFPADAPGRQLDHVLVDGVALTVTRCATPLMAISDHRPLVFDVARGRPDRLGSAGSG